jgi:hypothetical protein
VSSHVTYGMPASLIGTLLLVLLGEAVGIAAIVDLPTVHDARERARQAKCSNQVTLYCAGYWERASELSQESELAAEY